jgi:hypothetical protein
MTVLFTEYYVILTYFKCIIIILSNPQSFSIIIHITVQYMHVFSVPQVLQQILKSKLRQ